MSRLTIPAALLLGLVSFGALLGFGLLSPAAPVWRMPPGDMPGMLAGLEALSQDEWSYPPAVTDRLVVPQRTSLVLTDSVPWFALLLKALHVTPAVLPPLGLFLLLSHLLQGVRMVAVLRALGVVRPAVLIGGAALAVLLPAWLSRQLGHTALSAHFVLLFGLALCLSSLRRGLTGWHAAGFAVLLALCMGTHPYHVVPVALVTAAAFGAELLTGRGALPRVLAAGLGCTAAVGVSYAVLGYGVASGEVAGGGYGLYSMNLLGPVYPQTSSLAGQTWVGSWATGTVDPTGWQAFEGHSYLGAGILLILCAGLLAAVLRHGRADVVDGLSWRQAAPLVMALAALTVLAVLPDLWLLDHLVAALPLKTGRAGEVLSVFRANGRFFWMTAYALLAFGIYALDRRTSQPVVVAVLALAVGLQVADTQALRGAVGQVYAQPAAVTFPPALAAAAELRGRTLHFLPTLYCLDEREKEVVRQLSYAAIRNGGRSNSTPTGRNPWPDCNEPITQAHSADDILVLFRDSLAGRAGMARLSDSLPCYAMPLGAICGRGLDRIAGLVQTNVSDDVVDLPLIETALATTTQARPSPMFGRGWSSREAWGVWTDATVAELTFRRPPGPLDPSLSGVTIALDASGFAPPPLKAQHVAMTVNGHPLGEFDLVHGGWRWIEMTVPRSVIAGQEWLTVQLDIPGATPESATLPAPRKLGVGLRTIRFSPRNYAP